MKQPLPGETAVLPRNLLPEQLHLSFGTSEAFVLHFVITRRYYEILESNPIADAKYQYLWCRVLGPCSCYWLLVFMYDFLTLGKTKFCQAGLVLHGEGCYF
jgi:hypothetical protein